MNMNSPHRKHARMIAVMLCIAVLPILSTFPCCNPFLLTGRVSDPPSKIRLMLAKTRLEVQHLNSYTRSSRYRAGAWTLRCHAGVSEQQQQQQQQQDAAAATASIRQLLTRRSYAPPRYVGPIEVSQVPGRPHSQLPLPLVSTF
jgi:hypothetical protein